MKNKSLKFLLSLTVISCLLFTACGTDETIAPTAEATAEIEMESTTESESVVESEPESTVETEPIAESETQQGTIEGYEAPEEVEEEVVDKSELNDIGNESYNGEDEEEPTIEEPTVEEPTVENEGTPYTLTEGDKEGLRFLGATEDEINSIKTEEQFNALLDILMQRGGIPGGSGNSNSGGSGSSNSDGNSGSGSSVDEPHDPSRVPDLGNPEDTLPGSM